MPALILIIGIFLAGWALYRFMLRANAKEITALLMSCAAVIIGIAMFFLAITGRLPAALALFAAITPFIASWAKVKFTKASENTGSEKQEERQSKETPTKIVTRKDALDILGLHEEATNDEILDAYKTLMKKFHPDNAGSEGLAKQINMAKDFLINN